VQITRKHAGALVGRTRGEVRLPIRARLWLHKLRVLYIRNECILASYIDSFTALRTIREVFKDRSGLN
jgi:hypothetical protein